MRVEFDASGASGAPAALSRGVFGARHVESGALAADGWRNPVGHPNKDRSERLSSTRRAVSLLPNSHSPFPVSFTAATTARRASTNPAHAPENLPRDLFGRSLVAGHGEVLQPGFIQGTAHRETLS